MSSLKRPVSKDGKKIFGLQDMLELKNGILMKKKEFRDKIETIPESKWVMFKLQRPIATDSAVPKMLVYDRGKNWLAELPMTDFYYELFGEDFKLYVMAYPENDPVLKEGKLFIMKVLPPQDW